MCQEFLPILRQALRDNEFFDLASVVPRHEAEVTKLVLDYVRRFPVHREALGRIASTKDDVDRRNFSATLANVMAKWFTRRILVDPPTDDGESEEDRVWASIQAWTRNGIVG